MNVNTYGSLYDSLMILLMIRYECEYIRFFIRFSYDSTYNSLCMMHIISILFCIQFFYYSKYCSMYGSTTHIMTHNTQREEIKKKWIVPTCMQGLSTMRFLCNTTGRCLKAMLYLNHVSFDA